MFINVCPTPIENTAHAGKFTEPWQFLRDSLKQSCNVQGFSASQQESLGFFGHEENVTRALLSCVSLRSGIGESKSPISVGRTPCSRVKSLHLIPIRIVSTHTHTHQKITSVGTDMEKL